MFLGNEGVKRHDPGHSQGRKDENTGPPPCSQPASSCSDRREWPRAAEEPMERVPQASGSSLEILRKLTECKDRQREDSGIKTLAKQLAGHRSAEISNVVTFQLKNTRNSFGLKISNIYIIAMR
jgi:hypothetical protein